MLKTMTKFTIFPKLVKVIKVYDDWMSGTGRKRYQFAGWRLIVGRYYVAEHSKTICLEKGDKFILKEVYDKYGR